MALAYTEISKNKFRSWVLVFLFVLFVMGIGFAIGEYTNPGSGMGGLVVAAVISVIWTLVTYYAGDKITISASGAKPIEKRDNPQLYNLVENLAITAGLPTPKIYIMQDSALNAFATGRDPQHAIVAVTTGLLERLEKRELEGVLAHELSHVGNYDIRLLMIVTTLVGVIMIISDIFWRWSFWGGRGGGRRDGRAQLAMMAIGFLLIIFAPLFATLIKLAISRKRESLADASGALLTRYPEGLASALEKISGDSHQLRGATKGTAHLYISNPFKKGSWSKFFSTHPPIEERIKALRSMDV
ncbi:MAG: M48 family metallopeptidase [Candidatus Peregrinibacteria bacterium]|nr:M48 family metallopeptidase [Candidatus Peregrinibacteria bacterium]